MSDLTKEMAEDFIIDVRRLCLICGSQLSLAQELGVSLTTVHRWFHGYTLPTFDKFLRVKALLKEKEQWAKKERQ